MHVDEVGGALRRVWAALWCAGGLQGDGSLGPITSDDALNLDAETLSHLDDATRNCIEFMKYFVPKIFDST